MKKIEFFKGVPKRDGSGKGKRLNKNRGKCFKEEFDSDKMLKTAGKMAVVAGGILVGTKLIGAIADA